MEEVRRQLADRFDLVIPVRRPTDSCVVRSILRNSRDAGVPGLPAGEVVNCRLLAERAKRLAAVCMPDAMEELVARVYIDHSVESLRAVEAWAHAARLAALLSDRAEVTIDDLAKVAPLVLRHRVEGAVLSQILRDLSTRQTPASEGKPPTGGKDPESRPLPNKRSAAGGGLEGLHRRRHGITCFPGCVTASACHPPAEAVTAGVLLRARLALAGTFHRDPALPVVRHRNGKGRVRPKRLTP